MSSSTTSQTFERNIPLNATFPCNFEAASSQKAMQKILVLIMTNRLELMNERSISLTKKNKTYKPREIFFMITMKNSLLIVKDMNTINTNLYT